MVTLKRSQIVDGSVFWRICASVMGQRSPQLLRARLERQRGRTVTATRQAVLYEAVCYSAKWKDAPLALGAQDVQAAFDSVEHVDMLNPF